MDEQIKCIVAGTRTFTDRALLYSKLDFYFQGKDVVIVHGGCPTGADKFADEYVRDRFSIATLKPFPRHCRIMRVVVSLCDNGFPPGQQWPHKT